MIKTFEQFNELDPYGEEDWNDKNQIVYYIILYMKERNLVVVKGEITEDDDGGYSFHGNTIDDYDCGFSQEFLEKARDTFTWRSVKDKIMVRVTNIENFPSAFSSAIDVINPPDAENYDADFVFGMKFKMEQEIEEKGYLKLT